MSFFSVITFYIIIFIATSLFYIEKHYTTKNNIFEKISILFLIIVAGLRYNTGRDYLNYYQIYDWIKDGGERFEIGFYYLFKILGDFGFSYQFTLFLISTFVILVIYFSIIRPIPLRYRYVSLFFFLIIYENYFNIAANSLLRQSLAIVFFLVSIRYIVHKNFIKYLLVIIIGSLFHLSILLLIPFYFIKKINIKMMYFIVFLIPFFYTFPSLLSEMLRYSLVNIGLSDFANLNYITMIHREISIKEVGKNIFYIFVFVQFIYVNKLLKYKINDKEVIYIKLLLVGFIFKLYLSVGLDMFHRLIPYFYIFYIPVVFIFLREHKKIKNGYIMSLFFIFFMIFHIKQILSSPEYSKYYGQYQLVIFKNKQKINQDLSIWNTENSEILKIKIERLVDK